MRTECIKPARSLLRRALWFGWWGLLGIMVLALSLYVIEDWRGRAGWAKFKRAWEAKGEHFDLAALLAPPVPDDDNFLKAPLIESWFYKKPGGDGRFRPLIEVRDSSLQGSWRKLRPSHFQEWRSLFQISPQESGQNEDTPAADLLQKFTPYEAELKELYAEAARRTKSRPEFDPRDDVNSFALPNLVVLRTLSQSLALHAVAELALGQSDVAWQDLQVLQRLAETLRSHPSLVSAMVRVAVINLMIQPVWEGLAANRWNEGHLVKLQTTFSSLNLSAEVSAALKGERATLNQLIADRSARAAVHRPGAGDWTGARLSTHHRRTIYSGSDHGPGKCRRGNIGRRFPQS